MKRDLTELAKECQLPPERRQGKAGIWTFVRNLPQGFVTARLDNGDEMEFPFGFWRQMPLIKDTESQKVLLTSSPSPRKHEPLLRVRE